MQIVLPDQPRLDKRNPLAQGLVFDAPLNSKSGLFLPIDLVTGIRATSGGSGSKSQKVGKFGWAVDFNNTGQYFLWAGHPLMQSFNRVSIEVLFLRESGGNGGGYGSYAGQRDITNTTDWFSVENDNADSGWGVRLNTFYTNREKVWSIPYPSNNIWHHIIARYDHTNKDNTPDVWQDYSKLSLTNRFDNAWTRTINATNFFIANKGSGTGSSFDGQIALVRYWNRLLLNEEVWRLLRDPTELYVPSNVFSFARVPTATSNIKKLSSIAQANLKKVSGMTNANISKVSGVANV